MALFSFRHTVKTFSEKRTDEARVARVGQTAAHLRYICRPQAARVVLRERLSGGSNSTAARAAEEEAQRRKGRVCERFVVALPVEASQEQREVLARAYADRLSHRVAGYVVAIHDHHENDLRTPHAHFVFFDVQQKTGGRGRPKSTLGLARRHAIQKSAKLWADLHNEMMKSWGYGPETEISHLSYADRGIEQIPTIHEGAGARALSKKKKRSKPKWQHIDEGHSRAEANEIIREINMLKEQKNERADQLGGNYEGDRAKRQRSLSQQREHGWGDGQATGSDRPPFFLDRGNEVGASKPERASNPMRAMEREGLPDRPGRQPPFLADVRHEFARLLRRRGGIRRVFHELILLRGTLKARRQNEILSGGEQAIPCAQQAGLDQCTSHPKRAPQEIS